MTFFDVQNGIYIYNRRICLLIILCFLLSLSPCLFAQHDASIVHEMMKSQGIPKCKAYIGALRGINKNIEYEGFASCFDADATVETRDKGNLKSTNRRPYPLYWNSVVSEARVGKGKDDSMPIINLTRDGRGIDDEIQLVAISVLGRDEWEGVFRIRQTYVRVRNRRIYYSDITIKNITVRLTKVFNPKIMEYSWIAVISRIEVPKDIDGKKNPHDNEVDEEGAWWGSVNK